MIYNYLSFFIIKSNKITRSTEEYTFASQCNTSHAVSADNKTLIRYRLMAAYK